MKIERFFSVCTLVIALGAMAQAQQQPTLSVPKTNTACNDAPKLVGGQPEKAMNCIDADGFRPLFNGTDLKGWWENCNRHADGDLVNGGYWIWDPAAKALYSSQNNGSGGMWTTNEKFEHYEIVFDFWPTFGNDGGVFNRNTLSGKNWQTTLDYVQGSSVGGSFNENAWTSGTVNDDPIKFNSSPTDMDATGWTAFTKNLNPTSFGCSAGGCTAADFPKVWNLNGWNQVKVRFYGGLTSASPVKMETFFRKLSSPAVPWVPVYKREIAQPTPAGWISFQIHKGSRWKAGTADWYRDAKVLRLKDDGTADPEALGPCSVGTRVAASPLEHADLKIVNGMLTGSVASANEITVRNVAGRIVDGFSQNGGMVKHALSADARGILFIELKGARGTSVIRLSRI